MPHDARKRCEYSVDSIDGKEETVHVRRRASQSKRGRDGTESICTRGRREEEGEEVGDWLGEVGVWLDGRKRAQNRRGRAWTGNASSFSVALLSDKLDSKSHAWWKREIDLHRTSSPFPFQPSLSMPPHKTMSPI